MCRSIKTLRRPGEGPSEEDINDDARQFVRKISSYHRANQAAFNTAVADIAEPRGECLER